MTYLTARLDRCRPNACARAGRKLVCWWPGACGGGGEGGGGVVAWGYLCVVTFVNSDLDRIAGGEGFRGMCSQRHRVEGVTSVGLTVRASFFAIIHIVYDTPYRGRLK